jgi:glycosyltransferase involved in cell wall biosynthesis
MVQGWDAVKKVAFIFEYSEAWLGGLNYFRNLISAIADLPDRKIEPIIFVGNNILEQQLAGLPKIKIVRSRILNRESSIWRIGILSWRPFKSEVMLESLLNRHKIDVLSHSKFLYRNSRIPSIEWIPDFQHFYLSDFYTSDEISRRIADNRAVCTHCSCILLSSHDALKDLKLFFPECAEKAKVLQFVADVAFDDKRTSSQELQKKYGFQGSYFLVPNQFWAHKNHKVIIEALHLLRESGRDLLVLATGGTHDHRQPQYYQTILELAKKLKVEDCFKVLGIVPREDLMGLMYDAVALINPSLFEGWSSVVEEAKSLGKRLILSDIAVHHEQNPQGALFFPAKDAHELAGAMYKMISSNDPDRDQELMIKARDALPQRRQDFAKTYQDIVISVTGL